MHKIRLLSTARALVAGLAVLACGTMAQAQSVQFATFNQLNGDVTKPFTYANNGNTGSAGLASFISAPGLQVSFSFTGVPGAPTSPFVASVVMTGSTSSAVTQTVIPGVGTLDTEAVTSTIVYKDTVTGKNLLTAVISGTLSGFDGGTSVSLTSSTVTYSSDYLNFSGTVTRALTFQFNPTNTPLTIASNGLFNTFSGTGSGQFSSNPPPVSATTPEPASVAMLGLGLAFPVVLVHLRKRKSRASA